jgi:integrase
MTLRLFSGAGATPSQGSGSVAVVTTSYLADMDARRVAGLILPESADRARRYCQSFADFAGQVEAADVKRADVTRWLAGNASWKSPHTLHDAVGAVVACLHWAKDNGIIERSPEVRPKDLPACMPKAASRADEIRAVLHQARHGRGLTPIRFRIALWFLAEVGCRPCEMRRLDWSQYDDAKGTFTLPSKTTRKTGQLRLIVLPSRAWRLIRALRRWDKRPRGTVFLNGRDRPWTRVMFQAHFRRHGGTAGIREEVKCSSARHGFTCERLEAGVGDRQLADYLGHTSSRYVGYYGKAVKSRVDYLRHAADKR